MRQLASQPSTAAGGLIALLLGARRTLCARQLESVTQRLGPAEAHEAAALADRMATLPRELRLPFVALAVPQLAFHPRAYQDALMKALNDLALADNTVTTFEYCVTRLVWSYLRDAADPSRRSKIGSGSLSHVRAPVTTLLATLAVAGGDDPAALSDRASIPRSDRLYPDGAPPDQPRAGTWQQPARQGLVRAGRPGAERQEGAHRGDGRIRSRRRHSHDVRGRTATRGMRVDARPTPRAARLTVFAARARRLIECLQGSRRSRSLP